MPFESPPNPHIQAAFWLDVSDKVIKAFAVVVGAAWTWMHYARSRTYAKKLELQLSGDLVEKNGLILAITSGLRNLGASRHAVQQQGTSLEVVAILADLSEIPLRIFTVFELNRWIEPGMAVTDLKQCRILVDPADLLWLRLELRVVWKDLEWNFSHLIKVE